MCKDPALSYLNQFGYNVVKLPRAGIGPLDVLGRDQALEKLGTISEVWTSTQPVPKPGEPAAVGGMNGQMSHDLDLGVGLKILAGVLGGMGSAIGLPTLNLTYQKARSVQFKFTDVVSVQVTPFAIGTYLASGTLDSRNPFVTQYFGNDGTQEYILSEVLQSSSVSVTAKDDSKTAVKVDVPALQGVVGANVSVGMGKSGQAEVVYTGKQLLTFGFKAYQVTYADGKWGVQGTKAGGALAFPSSGEAPPPVLLNEGQLLRLNS